MSRVFRHLAAAAVGLWAMGSVPSPLLGQTVPGTPNSGERAAARKFPTPPPLPIAKAPVELFRQLLRMNAADENAFLAKYPPQTQKRVREKLQEYKSLTPEQAELRLRVTELWYYLPPLMAMPSTNRAPQLASIPEEIRALLEIKLARYDALPPDRQQEILTNGPALHYLFQFSNSTPIQQSQILTNMSQTQRAALAQNLQKWQNLTESERRNLKTRFEEFFGLTPHEQVETLSVLPETERQQIEDSLSVYRHMTRSQRIRCVSSFDKLANLTPRERQEFLRDAWRWNSMTESERQAWRKLVDNLRRQPPLPSDLIPPPPPPPPPRPRSLSRPAMLGTNR